MSNSSSINGNFYHIDQHLLRKHLYALGFKDGDKVNCRLIPKSTDKNIDIKNKLEFILPNVPTQQNPDYSLYLIPNPGGQTAKEITEARTLFCDFDDGTKEEQLKRLAESGLPEPTIIIETAKGYHAYWLLEEPIKDLSLWTKYQKRLIKLLDTDKCIHDPSRVMRSAGSWYVKEGIEPFLVKIYSCSNTKYSLEALESLLSKLEEIKNSANTSVSYSANSSLFPITQGLTLANRDVLSRGINKGGRNSGLAAFVRDALGVESSLRRLGQPYVESPKELLEEANLKCKPPLDNREVESIWNSAFKDNPTASLDDEKLLNCIASFLRKNTNFSKVTNPLEPPKTKQTTPLDDDRKEIKNEVEQLTQKDFDIYQILPSRLAKELISQSRVFAQPPVIAALMLLVTASSLLGTGTKVVINVAYNHIEPSILWGAVVGVSDSGKSPLMRLITDPLQKIQGEEYEQYLRAKEEYDNLLENYNADKKGNKEDLEKPVKPYYRKLIFSDFTTEAVFSYLSPFPNRGAMVLNDELAAFFKGLGQYKSSGNDRQRWLDLYNGSPIDVIRVNSEPIRLEKSSIQLLGGIQPTVLREIMGDLEQVDGLWTRFTYLTMSDTVMPDPDWDAEPSNLRNELYDLYRRLDTLEPCIYELEIEARPLWIDWHRETEGERQTKEHPAIRAIYRKARSKAARLAVVIHCLAACYEGRLPDDFIRKETLLAGIELSRYSIKEALRIYADFGIGVNLVSPRIAKFLDTYKNSSDWITRGEIQRKVFQKHGSPSQVESFAKEIVQLGYVETNNLTGKYLKVKIIPKKTASNASNDHQRQSEQGFKNAATSASNASNDHQRQSEQGFKNASNSKEIEDPWQDDINAATTASNSKVSLESDRGQYDAKIYKNDASTAAYSNAVIESDRRQYDANDAGIKTKKVDPNLLQNTCVFSVGDKVQHKVTGIEGVVTNINELGVEVELSQGEWSQLMCYPFSTYLEILLKVNP